MLSLPSGTSDPYVKFKIAGKEVFRSKTIHKNLNPVWDERVSLHVETLRDPLYVKVQQKTAKLQMSFYCNIHFFHFGWLSFSRYELCWQLLYCMLSLCRFLTMTLDFRMISWAQPISTWSHWNIRGLIVSFALSFLLPLLSRNDIHILNLLPN